MIDLDPRVARTIVDRVGGPGEPPLYGFQFFTAGLGPYLNVIEEEYLATFVRQGGATFKMVTGAYGGGKTHFLFCVRDIAWKHNFVVSYVSLKQGECPFHKLEEVYKAIVQNITAPLLPIEILSGYERGIESLLRSWYSEKLREIESSGISQTMVHDELLNDLSKLSGIESISFRNAVTSVFRLLMDRQDQEASLVCQWLQGEGYDRHTHLKYNILQKIDKTTAFTMLRSLIQWVRQIGYSGLVVLLDEAERVPSLSSKQKETHLSNLREIIDECGHITFQGGMIIYAVPDETFLEGRTQVYEALRQRLATVFDDELNPSGVKIELERVVSDPISFLIEVGEKLAQVYEKAYSCSFNDAELEQIIAATAEEAYNERYGDIGYKRVFVQRLIQAFHTLRRQKTLSSKNGSTS